MDYSTIMLNLIIAIVVLVVLYILFLPPDERARLLENNVTDDPTHPDFRTTILLREHIGELTYLGFDFREYDFPSFSISTEAGARLITSKSSAYVKNSVFDEVTDRMEFSAKPELTDNLLLSFNVDKASRGRLRITLNGETMFNSRIPEGNSPPIQLDSSLLRNNNELKFSVSGPGIIFWRYNEYELSSLQILGDVTDVSLSEHTNSFIIPERELDHMKSARLSFVPVCDERQVREFEVFLNHDRIFRGIPDCGVLNMQTIARNQLRSDRNTLEFRVGAGRVLVDRPRLGIEMEEEQHLIYYFELEEKYFRENNDDYELISPREVFLEFSFPNNDPKRFEVFVNGYRIGINIARTEHDRNISSFVRPGTNSIEIRPQQDFTITEMRVRLK